MFDGTEGGWRVINPPGRYRLIGVDKDKDIYIAKVDEDDKALSVMEGRLGVGFETVDTFATQQDLKDITVASIQKTIEDKRSSGTGSDNKK